MRREAELIDWRDLSQRISAGDQNPGVAREAVGVARHGDDLVDAGFNELLGLGGGAGARRIEHPRVELRKLLGVERFAKQITRLGYRQPHPNRRARGLGQRGDRFGVIVVGANARMGGKTQGESAEAAKQIRDALRAANGG